MSTVEVANLRRVDETTLGVVRRSTKEVVAVDDISFDVHPGELFGLLGPSGAGPSAVRQDVHQRGPHPVNDLNPP